MTAKQRSIIGILVVTNVVVYGVLGVFAFTILLKQEGVGTPKSQRAPTEIALEETAAADTQAGLPMDSAIPTLTASPPTTLASDLLSAGLTGTPSPTGTRSKAATAVLAPRLARTPTVQRTLSPVKAAAAPASPDAPSGDSPSNPMAPGGASHLLAPGASAWYKVGNGGDHMDVFLEADPLGGMTLEVYAPGNLQRPIGQGSLDNTKSRLVWAGGHWNSSGDWLARVTNTNPTAAQYKLISATQVIGTCDSHSYWEYIGKYLVYWTACR